MGRLTEEQRRLIFAERAEGASLSTLAKKYGVAVSSIQRMLQRNKPFQEEVEAKQRQIEESVLQHMEAQGPRVCMLLDELLAQIGDKDKQAKATILQIATTMGILIDKFVLLKKHSDPSLQMEDDPITKALKESMQQHVKREAAQDS